tara:strand:+ start:2636 stop:2884 length:249 start_codon:yes stop_codon:yes gene_type:complete
MNTTFPLIISPNNVINYCLIEKIKNIYYILFILFVVFVVFVYLFVSIIKCCTTDNKNYKKIYKIERDVAIILKTLRTIKKLE